MKFTNKGHLGVVAKSFDISYGYSNSCGVLVNQVNEKWDTSFVLIFPLTSEILGNHKSGEFYDNYSDVGNSPLGKLLKNLHEMDQELGYSKIKEKDYELLNQIREIRNYWCHQCYIDFHYIEDPQEHEKAFQKVTNRLHEDELRVYELQQKIEKLRKNVERKHRHKK